MVEFFTTRGKNMQRQNKYVDIVLDLNILLTQNKISTKNDNFQNVT